MYPELWELPQNMPFWLCETNGPWIVNIDLDYLFCGTFDEELTLMVSDDYLDRTFSGLKEAMDRNDVAVVTLCLTPDTFTPGWEAAEALAERILAILGLKFRLP